MKIDFSRDLTEAEIEYLKTLPREKLIELEDECEDYITLCDTNQINRKTLINSLYGALGNIYFRFYDLRNAEAITIFGQLVLQWTERKINAYLNELCGTTNHAYVIYGDTDSLYIELSPLIEKVGIDKFSSTEKLVDFLDAVGSKKIEPVINAGFQEMCEYLNNYEQLMFMDREAIACPPLGSNGIGAFWRAKKRYALNVWDMEGTRFKEPYLKIMGMETQQSSTPKAVKDALLESIRIMLQEGEKPLQEYFKKFDEEFRNLDYKVIAGVRTANNISKYDDNGYPGLKCPNHIRGVLTYRRAIEKYDNLPNVGEGDKVMIVPLKDGNPFGDKCIAWPSGIELPKEIRSDVLKHMDVGDLFSKTFKKPLSGMCEAAGLKFEKKASLEDIFGF
ncbi:DNA polymerase domain-containing protein [Acinetobacter baumannii]